MMCYEDSLLCLAFHRLFNMQLLFQNSDSELWRTSILRCFHLQQRSSSWCFLDRDYNVTIVVSVHE